MYIRILCKRLAKRYDRMMLLSFLNLARHPPNSRDTLLTITPRVNDELSGSPLCVNRMAAIILSAYSLAVTNNDS